MARAKKGAARKTSAARKRAGTRGGTQRQRGRNPSGSRAGRANARKSTGQGAGASGAGAGADARLEARRLEALRLRKLGYTYRAIAAETEVSPRQAFLDVKQAIEAIREELSELADEVLTLELGRLDDMLYSIREPLRRGEFGAIDRALRISERRDSLLGLSKPTKIAPTTPDGESPYAPPQATDEERTARLIAILEILRQRRAAA